MPAKILRWLSNHLDGFKVDLELKSMLIDEADCCKQNGG